MTRQEEIKEASKAFDIQIISNPLTLFEKGAEWADKHPDAISMNYLHSWYQCSVDETQEPIWTDKHLEELFNDFYLIPKR